MMVPSVCRQVVGHAVDGEGAVCDSVRDPTHRGPEVGIVVFQVVVDVVETEVHVAKDAIFVRDLLMTTWSGPVTFW